MAKLVVSEFLSLDGVMEDPGGDSDFKYGGWTRPYTDEEFMKIKTDELAASDSLLLGRLTYEGFAAAWPQMEETAGEFGAKMNAMPKYVVSNTLKSAKWKNSKIIGGKGLAASIKKLKQVQGKDILVNGSGQLVRFLLDHKLVDELRLLVYPVTLGEGKRLFKDNSDYKLSLMQARQLKSGVVLMEYRPEGVKVA
jgi:dihydrofolate reductase